MTDPLVTVAICTHNRHDLLHKAVRSCLEQTLEPGQFQILVVDNSSDKAAARQAEKKYQTEQQVTYILEETVGLSHARNRALALCDSPFIAYLDDDAVADPGWLLAFLDGFDKAGADVCVLGGRSDPLWEGGYVPGWLIGPDKADCMAKDCLSPANHERLLFGVFSIANWGGELRPYGPGEWVAGCNMIFRTDALRNIGGFDVGLGRKGAGAHLLSGEEGEAISAIEARGGLCYYCPDARVRHLVAEDRLKQEWVIKRNLWQVVTDFIRNADQADYNPSNDRKRVHALSQALKESEKGLQGLLDMDDEVDFDTRMFGVIALFRSLLHGVKPPG